jgi:hypothetical protein
MRVDYIKKYNPKTQKYNPSYNYKQYVVVNPFKVEKCTIAPWFGFKGQATQYNTDVPISDLVKRGDLELVTHHYPPFFDKVHEENYKKSLSRAGGKKKKRYSRTRNKRRLTHARKSRKVFRNKRI